MADDVERLNNFAIGAAQIYFDRHGSSGDRGDIACADRIAKYVHVGTNEQAALIATLRADLAKAVEGLGRIIEVDLGDGIRGIDLCRTIAQSLIKELRP